MIRPVQLVYLCNSPAVPAGVEKTVMLLLRHMDPERVSARAILNGDGPFAEQLRDLGCDVEVLPCRGRVGVRWCRALRRSLAERPAEVVQLHLSRVNAPILHASGAAVVERLNMFRHRAFMYPLQWQWLDRFTSRWLDRFVVVSESLAEHFRERGYPPGKLTVIHNGVAAPEAVDRARLRLDLALPARTRMVGAVGRLTEQKGMDTFLAAAGLVAERREDVHFVVAGDGELRGALERKARECGLTGRVSFLGFRRDVFDVLAGLDVLVYLSRWEPFANTLLEAMAVGVPVVASNVGGNAEALLGGEAGGLLVPPEDPEPAASAILELLGDPGRAREASESGRGRAEEFTVAQMVRGHEDVYLELAGNRPERTRGRS